MNSSTISNSCGQTTTCGHKRSGSGYVAIIVLYILLAIILCSAVC